jgi:hypothetical protein
LKKTAKTNEINITDRGGGGGGRRRRRRRNGDRA